jgi:hypothetical protein
MDTSRDRLNRIWVRNEVETYIPLFRIKELNETHFHWGYKINMFYVVVAGKTYPVLQYSNSLEGFKYITKSYSYYYTLEEFDKDHPEVARSIFNSRSAKVGYAKGKIKDQWKDFFRDYKDLTDLCLEFQTPVFRIDKHQGQFLITKNIELKAIEFYKVMDPFTVYQEIDMFMSNVMANDDMPMSPMTDLEKVESHGFDKKISFRKGKGE